MHFYSSIQWKAIGLTFNSPFFSFWICDTTYNFVQVDGVQHSGPKELSAYVTRATNISYTFGRHTGKM
ncbi:hypothetical protein L1987_43488 [Smallanthus sonchifolius]|uniref:Uncharacterized protein n=1 Tax=Smallanthus sonchifolius TaxID=185202 RepID=A0ACB9GL76_9ASTR|nr:hypothetical protein L1987_43488 [Smallanthus sonchifolius]